MADGFCRRAGSPGSTAGKDARRYRRGARGRRRRQPCLAELSRRSRTKAEVKRRRKRSTTEMDGRETGGMANYFLLPFQAFDLTIKLFTAIL